LAKDSDKLAAELQTDDGLLSSVLAEETEFGRRMLWRLGSWGFAAVGAVTVAVMANQSSLTLKRNQLAAADFVRQAQQLQTLTKESQSETRRLALAVDTLNSDRDRLYSRVTTLEQSLDSVTGAIAKHAQMPVAAPLSAATAPAVAPVASASPAPADKPAVPEKAAASGDKPSATMERPALAARPQAGSDKPSAPGSDNAPVASASAAPGPAASTPVEPAKGVTTAPLPEVATAAPVSEAADDDSAPRAQVQRTEFGVDLGTANSVNGLRALWRGLLKSKANAPLGALRPIMVIKEGANGLGMQLRLVAGPLNDAGTAARICAELSPSHRTCETAIYDGQRLSLKSDDALPTSKPLHRRSTPKHVTGPPPPPVAEEKKPEPTTFSSIFRRNSQ